jgi:hypothetical protein
MCIRTALCRIMYERFSEVMFDQRVMLLDFLLLVKLRRGVFNYITKPRKNGLTLGDQSYHVRDVATLSPGLATKARGLQGCGPRVRPESAKSVREWTLTLTHKWTPTWGVEVPNGLPNLHSVIAGIKTHCLEELFISLESYWNLNV